MSPKSLDPLSQRKNDSAAAESTSPVPRGVDATRVLEKAQATVEARKEAQAKSKRQVIFGLLFAGLVVFLAGAAITIFRDAQKNQLADDEYAIIEGRRITNTEFQELKSAYIRYDKQKKQENEKVSERRAADELLTRVGLEVQRSMELRLRKMILMIILRQHINNMVRRNYCLHIIKICMDGMRSLYYIRQSWTY